MYSPSFKTTMKVDVVSLSDSLKRSSLEFIPDMTSCNVQQVSGPTSQVHAIMQVQ